MAAAICKTCMRAIHGQFPCDHAHDVFFFYVWNTGYEPEPLIIFGHQIFSEYPEDKPIERANAKRGVIFAKCYSVACEYGESGSVDAQVITLISKDDFEKAEYLNWRVPGYMQ